MQETDKSPEQLEPLVQQFAASFIPRQDCYPQQVANGSYRTRYKPLTSPLLLKHIRGEITLGAYALDASSHAQWLCFDADTDAEWATLYKFAATLKIDGLTAYLELVGSKNLIRG